jgi:3D (Asp-Asp-Asp) domain-containing protein
MRRTLVLAILLLTCVPGRSDAKPRKAPRAGRFTATAYCRKGETASGERAATGIVAADPRIIPLGSVVQVDGVGLRRGAKYSVEDKGVTGRRIDIFMPSCRAAKRYGRRPVRVRIVQRAAAAEERR